MVWGLVAIEQVPLVQTVNKYVNVLDEFFTHTHNDTTAQYGRKVSVRQPLPRQLPCSSAIRMCLTREQSRTANTVTFLVGFCVLVQYDSKQISIFLHILLKL